MKAGFIALVGAPNAGKSTLLNLLVKEKVAIVSPKPQTTRRRVLGLVTQPEEYQAVFVDSPGVVRGHDGLNAFLEKEWQEVIEDCDAIVVVLNIDESKKKKLLGILDLCIRTGRPMLAVISKVDQEKYFTRQLILEEELRARKIPFLKGSLLKNQRSLEEGEVHFREKLLEECIKLLPESRGPMYSDEDLFTPHSVRELAAEFIREACFVNLTHELPYNVAVRMVQFLEDEVPPKIFADIIVAKESQKPILIGKEGQVLKKIGSSARAEIEKLLGHKVFLKLQIVVRDRWYENPMLMKEFGYGLKERSKAGKARQGPRNSKSEVGDKRK